MDGPLDTIEQINQASKICHFVSLTNALSVFLTIREPMLPSKSVFSLSKKEEKTHTKTSEYSHFVG